MMRIFFTAFCGQVLANPFLHCFFIELIIFMFALINYYFFYENSCNTFGCFHGCRCWGKNNMHVLLMLVTTSKFILSYCRSGALVALLFLLIIPLQLELEVCLSIKADASDCWTCTYNGGLIGSLFLAIYHDLISYVINYKCKVWWLVMHLSTSTCCWTARLAFAIYLRSNQWKSK